MGAVKELKQEVINEVLVSLYDYLIITDRIRMEYGGVRDLVEEFSEFLDKKEMQNG